MTPKTITVAGNLVHTALNCSFINLQSSSYGSHGLGGVVVDHGLNLLDKIRISRLPAVVQRLWSSCDNSTGIFTLLQLLTSTLDGPHVDHYGVGYGSVVHFPVVVNLDHDHGIPGILTTLCPDCPVKVGDYSRSDVQPKAVIKGNTLLGAGCALSDRTTVADSSLGRNCVVKPGCRVTGCVLLDGVSLEPGSVGGRPGVSFQSGTVLEGSIVCCTLDQEKCTVKSSIVASARTLHPQSKCCAHPAPSE
ncbi:Trimeric LpxA-like [Trinorchestia longiramus]|nr:Trimeric LpxA-like [Trinorchestia longiramus]